MAAEVVAAEAEVVVGAEAAQVEEAEQVGPERAAVRALVGEQEQAVAARELVAGPEQAALERVLAPGQAVAAREQAPEPELPVVVAVVTVMVREILMSVHTVRTGSTRECFGFKGAIEPGSVAAGLATLLLARSINACLVRSINARSSLSGIGGGMRRACTISTGFIKPSE